uniref:Uncharacterized protein n=1 Tax=mine drainage metagenome TaxID=410659 RepID=E6PQ23_9ZZZZ
MPGSVPSPADLHVEAAPTCGTLALKHPSRHRFALSCPLHAPCLRHRLAGSPHEAAPNSRSTTAGEGR